jgi:hypothetical protein
MRASIFRQWACTIFRFFTWQFRRIRIAPSFTASPSGCARAKRQGQAAPPPAAWPLTESDRLFRESPSILLQCPRKDGSHCTARPGGGSNAKAGASKAERPKRRKGSVGPPHHQSAKSPHRHITKYPLACRLPDGAWGAGRGAGPTGKTPMHPCGRDAHAPPIRNPKSAI